MIRDRGTNIMHATLVRTSLATAGAPAGPSGRHQRPQPPQLVFAAHHLSEALGGCDQPGRGNATGGLDFTGARNMLIRVRLEW